MADKEARWEEERNYCKTFYNMANKVDKLFAKYEKTLKLEKNGSNDHASVNHGGGGEEPPPSPSTSESSSSSSHHSNKNQRNASKKSFFKLDVKFDLLVFTGESNVEKLYNWLRQVEVYCRIQ